MPAAFRNAPPSDKPDTAPELSSWWKQFGSGELDSLMAKALDNNHEVRIALHRVREAEAQAKAAGSSLLPTVSGFAEKTSELPAGGVGSAVQYGIKAKPIHTDQFGIRVSYELDFWGKNRSGAEAGKAEAEATEHARRIVLLTLQGDVAMTYFLYRQLHDRLEVARGHATATQQMLGAVEARVAARESTVIELMEQRSAAARAKAQVAAYSLQREQARNRLATLLGVSPTGFSLTETGLDGLKVPKVAPGLPSDILLRRPDIAKAEADLRTANANIGVARARFLPSFMMTDELGRGAHHLADLLSPASLYYSLASSVTQVIFDAGKTQAGVDYSKERFNELVEAYRHSAINALRDVEDTLAGGQLLEEQEMRQAEGLAAIEEAYDKSRNAYEAGALDFMTLLETQRARHQSRDEVLQTRLARLNTAVGLFKALGGDVVAAATSSPTRK